MKYDNFLKKLKQEPKKFKDIIKNEYDKLGTEKAEIIKLTLTLITIVWGLGEIILFLFKLKALIIFITYLILVTIITLFLLYNKIRKIEIYLSTLREMLVEDCKVSAMSLKKIFLDAFPVYILAISLIILGILQILISIGLLP